MSSKQCRTTTTTVPSIKTDKILVQKIVSWYTVLKDTFDLKNFFNTIKTIAVIGLSNKAARPSHKVASYLQSQGFRIIPVNPKEKEVLGEKAYPDLLAIPKEIHIDVVDIFRRSEDVMPHVRETIQRGDAKTIWMQEGIINQEAEELATQKGLNVIMNFCLMKAHKTSV